MKQSETDTNSWLEAAAKELRAQKIQIESLKRMNEQQRSQMSLLKAPSTFGGSTSIGRPASSNPTAARSAKEFDALKDQLQGLASKVEYEQKRNKETLRMIGEYRQRTMDSRAVEENVNFTRDSHIMVDKQIKVLENRLDMSLVQFNAALKVNKELREQIDTLRRERDVFDTIYQKLERELQEKKKEMAFIIEVSNIAYEERDNANSELTQLRTFAQEELKSFDDTFKELDQLLEEDRKMKETVKARIADREKKDREARAEQAKKKPTVDHKVEVNQASDVQTIQMYEDAFAKITAATEIPDLQQLVAKFLHSEDDNFSLFNYVNELHNEVEKLEDQNLELQTEIERMTSGSKADQVRKKQLKGLEDQLRTEDEKCAKFEQLSSRCEGILREIVSIVDQMFTRLDCDEGKIVEAQGIAELTIENILLYLASIEVRADEYLKSYLRQSAEGSVMLMSRGPAVPFDSTPIMIDAKRLPTTGDDAEGSDEEDRVLTHEEMLKKARDKLQRNQQNNMFGGKGAKVGGKKGTPASTKKAGFAGPAGNP
jgi:DNA repair exonuclease SbcCD ATPase subunit